MYSNCFLRTLEGGFLSNLAVRRNVLAPRVQSSEQAVRIWDMF